MQSGMLVELLWRRLREIPNDVTYADNCISGGGGESCFLHELALGRARLSKLSGGGGRLTRRRNSAVPESPEL